MRRITGQAVLVLLVQLSGQGVSQAQDLIAAHPATPLHPAVAAHPARPAVADQPQTSPPSPPASAYTFGYDNENRLVEASDLSGSTATYNWDPAGNLLSVARQSSAVVAVTQVVPGSGSAGSSVEIYGTDFSTTLSQDTVKFNGTAATVTSATATQLIVTVPSGASTGTALSAKLT